MCWSDSHFGYFLISNFVPIQTQLAITTPIVNDKTKNYFLEVQNKFKYERYSLWVIPKYLLFSEEWEFDVLRNAYPEDSSLILTRR